jgi:CubicO group peptidase (beta-lactamase class C family)
MKKHLSLSIILCAALSASISGQLTSKELKRIDESVNKAFEAFKPTGLSVAVVIDTTIVFHKAMGFSNTDNNTLATTSSLFNIASCSKAFTSASIGILVDEKKVKWTDKVTQYFPEFRLADPYITKEITVEDLLCHRSGLGTFYGDLLWYCTDYSDEEVRKRIANEPITRRFGIEFGYQNIMFMVAGDIIEKVTGQTWSQFVQSRLFTPLAMKETRPSNDELGSNQNIAYGHLNNKRLEIYDFNAVKPAASIYSTVDELSNWTIMLMHDGSFRGKQIISPSSVSRILDPHTILGTSAFSRKNGINFNTYALGWVVSDYYGNRIAEHDGGMPGYISKVTMVPEKKISMIILNNSNDGYVNSVIKNDLLEILLKTPDVDRVSEYLGYKQRNDAAEEKRRKERLDSRVMGTIPSLPPEGYTGTFRDKSYGDALVTLENGTLNLTFLPAKSVLSGTLEHWHYNTFKVQFKDLFLEYGLVTFDFDSNGKVTGFKIDLPSGDFHFWNLEFIKV